MAKPNQHAHSYLENFLVGSDGWPFHANLLVQPTHPHVDLWGAVPLGDGLKHSECLAVLTHCHVALRHGILHICVLN